TFMNDAFGRTFQVSKEDTEQHLIYTLGAGQWNIPKLRLLLEEIVPKHSQVANFEVTHDFPQVGSRTLLMSASRLFDDQGGKPMTLLAVHDITSQRKAESLAAALQEKEVLLKEIHHRVKNNLQIVSSLLNLQADVIKDPKALAFLRQNQDRIQSMALVHEKIYLSPDLSTVDMAAYIQQHAIQTLQAHTPADAVQLK